MLAYAFSDHTDEPGYPRSLTRVLSTYICSQSLETSEKNSSWMAFWHAIDWFRVYCGYQNSLHPRGTECRRDHGPGSHPEELILTWISAWQNLEESLTQISRCIREKKNAEINDSWVDGEKRFQKKVGSSVKSVLPHLSVGTYSKMKKTKKRGYWGEYSLC